MCSGVTCAWPRRLARASASLSTAATSVGEEWWRDERDRERRG
jgi:hypothetical protein